MRFKKPTLQNAAQTPGIMNFGHENAMSRALRRGQPQSNQRLATTSTKTSKPNIQKTPSARHF
jgi:hypothetical protein